MSFLLLLNTKEDGVNDVGKQLKGFVGKIQWKSSCLINVIFSFVFNRKKKIYTGLKQH